MGNEKMLKFIKLVMKLNKFRPSYRRCGHMGSDSRRSSAVEPTSRSGTIKLVRPDGSLVNYDRPIAAADLMKDFPAHLVCRSDTFYIGQRIPALSKTERLQLGHKYFLLPAHFFEPILSLATLASLSSTLSGSAAGGRDRIRKNPSTVAAAARSKPFHIQKTSSGSLKIRVSEEFISQLISGKTENNTNSIDDDKPKGKVCTTAELKKDYVQLVKRSSGQGKPKLETIKEKRCVRRKNKVSLFGIKRRSRANKRCAHKQDSNETEKLIEKTTSEESDRCPWDGSRYPKSKQKLSQKIR